MLNSNLIQQNECITVILFKTFSGLFGSDQCVCGMNVSVLDTEDNTQCNMDCAALNPTSKCGGLNTIAVYRAGIELYNNYIHAYKLQSHEHIMSGHSIVMSTLCIDR